MESKTMYEGMTVEELTATLTERDTALELLTKSEESLKAGNDDLIAERDSLLEELNELKETHAKITDELAETKKLNYRLGRTIGADTKTAEQVQNEAYSEAFKDIR